MIEQIIDHELAAKNRLVWQYKTKSRLESLLKAFTGSEIQLLEDTFFDLLSRLDIEASEGQQLDNLGTIVGQSREGLSDIVYRIFIKAKIGQNVSESDMPRVIDIWKLMTQANVVQVVEIFPAEVDLYADTPLPTNLVSLAFDLIQNVVGAGVLVGFIAVFDTDEAFGFADAPDTLGFGSMLLQGTNTSVVTNKLIDSGALFQTNGVTTNMVVYNVNSDSVSDIISVDSEIQLTLSDDIFTATPKDYYINKNVGGKLAYIQAIA